MIKTVTARQARDALSKKGFVLSEKGNRDHEMFFLQLDGQKTAVFFKISHGAREVRKDEIRNSARQMRIPGDDVYRILSCEHDATRTADLFREAFEGR